MGLRHSVVRQGRVKTGLLTELTKGPKGRNKSSHPHHVIIRSMLFPVRRRNSSSVKSQRTTVRNTFHLKASAGKLWSGQNKPPCFTVSEWPIVSPVTFQALLSYVEPNGIFMV